MRRRRIERKRKKEVEKVRRRGTEREGGMYKKSEKEELKKGQYN